ncbi:MAG: IS1634 family transposase, partial [Thermoleophilaceae bacterium]|nr:IS1634 family transposase [Thermoleophilaceae bacterium]
NPVAPIDPVAPAERSAAAKAKAGAQSTQDGLPASSLTDLLAELGTLCRNELRVGDADHTFNRLTSPTQLQARAFELLDMTPAA